MLVVVQHVGQFIMDLLVVEEVDPLVVEVVVQTVVVAAVVVVVMVVVELLMMWKQLVQ